MEQSIEFIFAKPVNENFFEMGINNLERVKWIHRDQLRHFLSDNISQDIISIAEIREMVETYQSFIVDNVTKEFYALDFDFDKKDITNTIKSRQGLVEKDNPFTKVINRLKKYKINA